MSNPIQAKLAEMLAENGGAIPTPPHLAEHFKRLLPSEHLESVERNLPDPAPVSQGKARLGPARKKRLKQPKA
ncbi:hypothetical protein EJ069_10310 [Mesorhizobium sp. M2A.F.Ca.ET.043.05.1.1]|nr:hypothetical protein EJ069_10310 [Mesorhizobium sp. M2A.F.Ca.ET.043.05.1.1]